jgi:hypothetical protein
MEQRIRNYIYCIVCERDEQLKLVERHKEACKSVLTNDTQKKWHKAGLKIAKERIAILNMEFALLEEVLAGEPIYNY